ncbi:MAG: hypothetical protein ACRD0S_05385, partial [Acidimicrobiales bacterium]
HGTEGLAAFERQGCLDAAPSAVRPIHAGRFLADAGTREGRSLSQMRSILARAGACLDSDEARRRFAEQAGRGLAHAGLGPDGWLSRAVSADIEQARQASTPAYPSSSAGVPV